MRKPATIAGYADDFTVDCERVLITLLRGLGPWKDSVFLVGGLTPRYLVPARPPAVPRHAGTLDVDVVIDHQILADTDAYHTLEENLKRLGFERATNDRGERLSWRWQVRTERGATMVLELLAEAPDVPGGRIRPLPTKGTMSALNIPHASIVFDLHQTTEIQARLLNEGGFATEPIRHADLVSFTCLKAFAYDQRFVRKDAHDLVYCIENAPNGADGVAGQFRDALDGAHANVIQKAMTILGNRFAGDNRTEGYRKDGPASVARFELGEENSPELRELRLVRQRASSDVIERLLAKIATPAR